MAADFGKLVNFCLDHLDGRGDSHFGLLEVFIPQPKAGLRESRGRAANLGCPQRSVRSSFADSNSRQDRVGFPVLNPRSGALALPV